MRNSVIYSLLRCRVDYKIFQNNRNSIRHGIKDTNMGLQILVNSAV